MHSRTRVQTFPGLVVREWYSGARFDCSGELIELDGSPVQFRTATAQRSISMRKQLVAAGVAATALVNQAMAAIPAEVTTAMTEARTDGLSVAGTLLGIAVAIWGALYIKRKFFG